MIYKKLKKIFNQRQLNKLYLIVFGSIFSTIFEVIGIGSIPVFALLGWKNQPPVETAPEPKVEVQTTEDLSDNLF